MIKLFKRSHDKIRFCGEKYVIEPKYRLFYISEDGEYILICRVPKDVLQLEMHRPNGSDIYIRGYIGLSRGDVIKVTVHNYDTHPRMSILEKACAVSERYIRYMGEGMFEEVTSIEYYNTIPYITIYNAMC